MCNLTACLQSTVFSLLLLKLLSLKMYCTAQGLKRASQKSDFPVVRLWLSGISSCCPGAAWRSLRCFAAFTDNLFSFTFKISLPTRKSRGGSRIWSGGGPQIVTGLKLPFWGLSFVEFWCWGLIFGGQGGGGPGPRGPPLDPPLKSTLCFSLLQITEGRHFSVSQGKFYIPPRTFIVYLNVMCPE